MMTIFLLRALGAIAMIAALVCGAFVANGATASLAYLTVAYLVPWSPVLLCLLASVALAWAAEVLALLGRVVDTQQRDRDPEPKP